MGGLIFESDKEFHLSVTPIVQVKRGFAGGPKFEKMTMPDNMSSY